MQLPEDSRTTLKRDLWGQPIPRNPEGKNPYLSQFVDVLNVGAKHPDDFKQALLDLFEETYSPDVYPTPPSRNFSLDGVTVRLDPKEYEFLQTATGMYRRAMAEKITSDPRFQSEEMIPEAKIIALRTAYEQGSKAGRQALMQQPGFMEKHFGELQGRFVPDNEEAAVVGRTPEARGRLRLMQR
jgi:hypothetical protein